MLLHLVISGYLVFYVILLCETQLNNVNSDFCQTPCYIFVRKYKSFKNGDVGVYIRENMTYRICDDVSTFREGQFETVIISTTLHTKQK